ncbi:MAG: protein-L-isoaspartate O-methyltransferase [Reyranellaceae bacterium]
MVDFAQARQNMVDGQLRPNRVTNPALLGAVGEIPRERFLPSELQRVAYVDDDIPLPNGRAMLEPLVVCRLIQAADPRPSDVALDIGCGAGYTSALLSRLASTVFGIDSDPALVQQAAANLAALGADNVVVSTRPMEQGWAEHKPYDVIVIGGAVEIMPAALLDQLAEGGRLVAVVTDGQPMGVARLYRKVAGAVSSRPLFDAGCRLLPGFGRPQQFVF